MQSGADAHTPDAVEGLVKKAQEGDAASFAGLYEFFYGKVFRYVLFRTGSRVEAEDITEEVFLRMLESITSFKWKGHPFSAWLFRIAHNLVVDHYRKKGRQQAVSLESATGLAGASPDVDSELDLKMSLQEVYEAMGDLTKLQREVLTLRFASGLSVLETAQAMGKKENAVKALQHAAVKNLRAILVPRHRLSGESQGPRASTMESLS